MSSFRPSAKQAGMGPASPSTMEEYLQRILQDALLRGRAIESVGEEPAGPLGQGTVGLHLGAWCGGRATFANCCVHEDAVLAHWVCCLAALKESAAMAYDHLARDLEMQMSPRDQVQRAEAAAEDQRRHFFMLYELAQKERASICPAPPLEAEPRQLFELASDNMVYGVVRETFAACVALHQSLCIEDDALRRVFSDIAHDTADHVRFALELNRWCMGQLSPARIRSLRDLKLESVRQLSRQLPCADDGARKHLGLPTVSQGRSILRILFESGAPYDEVTQHLAAE